MKTRFLALYQLLTCHTDLRDYCSRVRGMHQLKPRTRHCQVSEPDVHIYVVFGLINEQTRR